MTANTESAYSSPDGRRLLARRMHELERRIQIIRAAIDESEPNLELVQEHMRVLAEHKRIEDFLEQTAASHIAPDDPQLVEVGDTVTIRLEDGTKEAFVIVHAVEASVDDARISVESPLAKALLGRRVGENVEVAVPAGTYRCSIVTASRR
jgi:transcription elongation GreA/GreB family factor